MHPDNSHLDDIFKQYFDNLFARPKRDEIADKAELIANGLDENETSQTLSFHKQKDYVRRQGTPDF